MRWVRKRSGSRIVRYSALLELLRDIADTVTADRRMLWLRAYARKARWDEELVLVPFEMECTVRSFEHRAAEWEKWLPLSATPGHTAFAHRQVAMWLSLRDHAVAAFAATRAAYIP